MICDTKSQKRFEEQVKLKEAGDTDAQDHDKGFVEALKHGMLGRFWSPWTLEMFFELEKLGYPPIPG